MTRLETQRLIIEELNPGDAAFVLELLNDSAFIEHIGDRNVRTLEQALAYLEEKIVASYSRNGFGMYAVRLKQGGNPVGMCGLVKRESLMDIDIGYGFLPVARGYGYALESALAIKNWATETLGMERLVAIVSPDNQPSVTLLEKLGMRFETMIRLVEGDEDICLYAWNAGSAVVVDTDS